jgi:uncharacterized protein YggE
MSGSGTTSTIALVPATFLLLLATGPAASAQAQLPERRTISVNGSAEIRVVPNEVLLTVGVETNAMDITTARAENERRIKAVVDAARQVGVAAEHLRTDYLDIQPRYEDSSSRQRFLGYFARRSLVITLRDISRFEELLAGVLTGGANYVHGIEFRTTDLRKHRDAARERALLAAREKATAMAAVMGIALGAPVSITEGYSGWSSPYSSWWGPRGGGWSAQNVTQDSGRGASDEALVPGQISVMATVTVTFEINPARTP